MTIQGFKTFIFASVLALFYTSPSYAQQEVQERHIQVSLRMIGHEILLSAGDSTSRVLPVGKVLDRYSLQFEKELKLYPEMLVQIIDSVVKKSNIASSYIIEVEECASGKVVYGYEIGNSVKHDLVPCLNRNLPEACYRIYFTLLQPGNSIDSSFTLPSKPGEAFAELKGVNYFAIGIILIILLFSIILWLYFQKKKPQQPINQNLISVGAYQFNARTMELSYNSEMVELSAKEADLLTLLLNSANSTVEREHILKTVWGDEGSYIGRTLDVFISKLRKKLEADTNVKIVNVRGVGYKLILKG